MGENYADAAVRHWTDAELLAKEKRMENADQLYGLSAECALKSALVLLPGFSSNAILHDSYRKHVNELWNRINLQNGNVQKRYPGLVKLLDKDNPFEHWSIDQRYCADGAVSGQTLEEHRNAARRLLGAVGLNGVRK
jgi:hypothetical protein